MSTSDARFWSHVQKAGVEDCWLWTGYLRPNGYATILVDRRRVLIHRFAYTRHVGPIPTGTLVCHTCDVRHCVNPRHLFLGSHADNTHDMMRKDRQVVVVGADLPQAKLTEDDVEYIRTSTESQKQLAERFGVHQSQISRIKSGRRWGHLKCEVTAELAARIKAYAHAKNLSPRDAAVQLLAIALDHLEARTAGGLARQAGRSPAERSAAGRHAVASRWPTRQEPSDG